MKECMYYITEGKFEGCQAGILTDDGVLIRLDTGETIPKEKVGKDNSSYAKIVLIQEKWIDINAEALTRFYEDHDPATDPTPIVRVREVRLKESPLNKYLKQFEKYDSEPNQIEDDPNYEYGEWEDLN